MSESKEQKLNTVCRSVVCLTTFSLHSFFQIKVDIPPECRIYPIESEDEDEETRAASRGGVGAKEIICPWESLSPQNGTG